MAGQLSVQPWANARTEYSDNLELCPGYDQVVTGVIADLGFHAERADEQDVISLTPTLRSSRYDSNEPLNSNDQLLSGTWSRNSERGTWRVDGGLTHDSTLTSELEISGLVQTRKRRLLRYLSPSYRYDISSRTSVTTDVNYTSVKYKDALYAGLVNYDYGRVDMGVSYQSSERVTLTETIYTARMNAPQIGNRTDTVGAQLQISSAVTEAWDGTFAFGAYSNHEGIYGADRAGGLLNINLHEIDEKGEWRIGLNRSIDPSGTGVMVQRDQLEVTREQRFDERWSMRASAYWVVNKDLQKIAVSQDRRFRSTEIRVSRIIDPNWSMDAAYSYAWQRYAEQPAFAESNTLMLGIHYSGRRRTGS